MVITWKGSPNYSQTRSRIDRIVIHWFGIGTLGSANIRFQNQEADVSAHYGISGNTIYQWVEERWTAWHAGNWEMNKRSIGIEHDATTTKNLSEASYKTSAQLVKDIADKYGIPLDREHIIGHNEVKATQCPGTIDIDKIINLAKGTMSDDFGLTVKKATQWDKAVKYLELGDPAHAMFEDLQRVVAGYKSEVTTLKNLLSEVRGKEENYKDQISRLNDQLLNSENLRKDIQKQLNEVLVKLNGVQVTYEDQIKVLNGHLGIAMAVTSFPYSLNQ